MESDKSEGSRVERSKGLLMNAKQCLGYQKGQTRKGWIKVMQSRKIYCRMESLNLMDVM